MKKPNKRESAHREFRRKIEGIDRAFTENQS